jgi:hypothetical protein
MKTDEEDKREEEISSLSSFVLIFSPSSLSQHFK